MPCVSTLLCWSKYHLTFTLLCFRYYLMILHGEHLMGAFAQVGVKMFTSPVTNAECGSANQEQQTVSVSSTVVDEVQVNIMSSLLELEVLGIISVSLLMTLLWSLIYSMDLVYNRPWACQVSTAWMKPTHPRNRRWLCQTLEEMNRSHSDSGCTAFSQVHVAIVSLSSILLHYK